MPTVTISSRAHDAIRRASKTVFHETGVRLPNGEWNVPLTSDVIDALHLSQHPGETLSDTIERLLSFQASPKLS